MWMTENPWPLILVAGLLAMVCVGLWVPSKRGIWLVGAAIFLAAGAGVFVFERMIVTERELVEIHLRDLAAAFQKKDVPRTLGYFSEARDPRVLTLKTLIRSAAGMADIGEDLSIKDVSVRLTAGGSRAVARFRANASVTVMNHNAGPVFTRWEMTWQKEGGAWKIIDIERLHPIKDEVIDPLSRTAM